METRTGRETHLKIQFCLQLPSYVSLCQSAKLAVAFVSSVFYQSSMLSLASPSKVHLRFEISPDVPVAWPSPRMSEDLVSDETADGRCLILRFKFKNEFPCEPSPKWGMDALTCLCVSSRTVLFFVDQVGEWKQRYTPMHSSVIMDVKVGYKIPAVFIAYWRYCGTLRMKSI